MNLFIRKIIITICVFLSLAFVSILFMIIHIGQWDEIVFADVQKQEQLKQIKGPKMVFIGGSNLSYGLDSKMIEDSLHIQTYNMGLHAGLGLNYMFQEVGEEMKAGDILVVIPEYHQFSRVDGSAVLADLLLQTKNWKNLHLYKNWDTYPSYFCSKVYVPFLLKSLTGTLQKDKYADNPEGFNEKGDYILHLDQKRRNVARLLSSTPKSDAIKEIVNKIKWFQSKGVKVILLPPCFQQTCYKISENDICKINKGLQENGLSFAVSTDRYCFNDTLFWNTAYHLTQIGRQIRTQMLIEDIQNKL